VTAEETSRSMTQPAAQISNRILKSLLVHFKSLRGDAELRQAVEAASLGQGVDLAYLEDISNWVSFEDGQKLIDSLSERSKDPSFARRAGRITATRAILGNGWTILKAFGSPRTCYRETAARSRFFSRAGDFQVVELTRSHVVMSYRSRLPERNRHFCEYRMGQLESIPTIWGLPPAKGSERSCQVTGYTRSLAHSGQ